MRYAFLIALTGFGLAGCASTAQLAQKDDAYCKSIGANPGTHDYYNCRQLETQRREVRRAQADAMIVQGLAIAATPPPAPVQPPSSPDLLCTPNGGGSLRCR